MGINFLSDEDITILQEVILERKNNRNYQRSATESSWNSREYHPSPETYVAYPQTSAGIPKLLPSGTGTGTDVSGVTYDEPGKAKCDIYRIIENETTGDPELRTIGFSEYVYNLSSADLDQDWILITRTKFGKWVAVTAEGGEEIEVLTDWRVNTTDMTIEVKTRTVKVIPIGAESAWTAIEDVTDCAATGS